MQNAIRMIAEEGSIKAGDRIVAISGSPLVMRGATSTVRLYRMEADGSISGHRMTLAHDFLRKVQC